MKRVLVLARTFGKYSSEPLKLLQDNGFEIERRQQVDVDDLKGFDAVIVGVQKITREMMQNSSVKIIAKHGVGVDNIDLEAATELGIPVTVTPNANAVSVAELTIGFIFALSKKLIDLHNTLYQKRQFVSITGLELLGKTLGIVGFGSIGKEVAKRALCLGMRVLVYDPYVEESVLKELGFEKADLDQLLRQSDFVSLHVPLNESTRHLIDREKLSLMKKTAYLINTARGGVVDEEALVEALKNGQIAGAALDVFNAEPLPVDSPFFGCPNVIMTPHVGAHTYEAILRMNMMAAESIVDFFNNKIPKHVVNKEVIPRLLERGFTRQT
ncbi:MAG: phosphoglycerate dehydrogenase [Pseudothermotoga sp.]|uniref:phosphoglycerate dehydrogenase n=1 Tax=Pseudothermotoga sp. TaxID=2033661 RepID=UPI000E8C5E6B|nr:phosphoglycerate dehydrogenase [Pseudothermotoga sp.]HBT38959.1 hydroxyacid dehydrogenase [Pseudothermotoga sp.]HCO97758.1 hydroxyacid dehydrogenase [Pseudothermotoga sp.]